jgi:hypothetical protein
LTADYRGFRWWRRVATRPAGWHHSGWRADTWPLLDSLSRTAVQTVETLQSLDALQVDRSLAIEL